MVEGNERMSPEVGVHTNNVDQICYLVHCSRVIHV